LVDPVFLSSRNVFEFPALTEIWPDILVGFLIVCEAQVFCVPQELFVWESPTDRSEQHPFGVRAGDAEVRTSRLAALGGPNPVLEVAGRTFQHRVGPLVSLHFVHGQQVNALAPPAGAQETLCANKDLVLGADFLRRSTSGSV